jgi:predicted dehydrogenase
MAPGQKSRPPLLGQAMISFGGGQASMSFDAFTKFGPQDRTYVAGTKGSITSIGPNLSEQKVTLFTAKGFSSPRLKGSWFPTGFHGAMAELLCAIEEKREPSHGARDNLASLALCFAAVASAEEGRPVVPGAVRRMPG